MPIGVNSPDGHYIKNIRLILPLPVITYRDSLDLEKGKFLQNQTKDIDIFFSLEYAVNNCSNNEESSC